MRYILPYSVGNTHPGFMGWVHGGGTPVGMLAEMLAAGLNANLGGRDQIPIEVERQVVRWVRELFRFPDTASGLFVTGTSMANLIAVLVARTGAIGVGARCQGIAATGKRLIAYTSASAHSCIAQAMDLSGLGSDALRIIPVNQHYQIDIQALQEAMVKDKSAGLTSFFIAATAGTGRCRRDRRSYRRRQYRAAGKGVVPCGWRLRCASHAGAGPGASSGRDRTRGLDRVRFP